jgi:IPT/TIG domain/NHL repeat
MARGELPGLRAMCPDSPAARFGSISSGRGYLVLRAVMVASLFSALAPVRGASVAGAVSLPPSVLATVVGTGASGMPTPGPASASPLESPTDVVVDAAGDAFVADPGASEVLRVAAGTGALSVLAGTGVSGQPVQGPATSSKLSRPTGLAVDAAGDVWVADPGASEVLRIWAATGALSIVAGTGKPGMPEPGMSADASSLEAPTGVAVDRAGNLWLTDPGASEVLEVSAATGALSVVAGNGTAGMPKAGPAASSPLEEPSAIAVEGDNLLVADAGADEILKISLATRTLSVVAGTGSTGPPKPGPATMSPLSQPTGVSVDAQGNTWVADRHSAQVLEITPSGELSVVAGTGSPGLPRPGLAANSPLGAPTGVSVDGAGDVWLADAGAREIEEISSPPTVAHISPLAGSTGGGTTVTVSGQRFGDAMAIDFGSHPAEKFSCQSVNSCTAVAPPSDPGAVDISVTTPWGLSSLAAADQFSYYSAIPSSPTISASARSGPGSVAVSGTTTPRAQVDLWGAPYGVEKFSKLRRVQASARGTYGFVVGVERATRFYAVVEGRRSSTATAQERDLVAVVLSGEKRAVKVKVVTDPPVSGVEVTFYLVGPSRGLRTLGTAAIKSASGVLTQTFPVSSPTATVEAYVHSGDGVIGNTSPPQTVTVALH